MHLAGQAGRWEGGLPGAIILDNFIQMFVLPQKPGLHGLIAASDGAGWDLNCRTGGNRSGDRRAGRAE